MSIWHLLVIGAEHINVAISIAPFQ